MAVDAWHRKHAIQIAAALPDSIEDAKIVLELALLLVSGFLAGASDHRLTLAEDLERGKVVSLSSATSGSNR